MANTVEIHVRARDMASNVFDGVGRGMTALRGKVLESLAPLGQMALKLAAVASTAISAAPLLVPVVKAVYGVGQAAVQAAPALVAFAVAGIFVKTTLSQIFKEGSAARLALEPIAHAFKHAGEHASEMASRGIKPLAQEFVKMNFPAIRSAMDNIGIATNKVMKGFLGWANSTQGVKTIRNILDPIGKTMIELAPKIAETAISFAKMLGRIMGVSMAAGKNGLSGIMDKLIEVMDKINAKSVGGGLSKLKDTVTAVRDAISTLVGWIKQAVAIYELYQTKFALLADAIALIAIAFGGPVIAVIAAVGIIIRHFDEIKAAYQTFVDFFTKTPEGAGFLDDIKSAASEVWPHIVEAFEKIKEAVMPVLSEIFTKLKEEFIPAFGDLIDALAPVVSFFIDILGPFVAETMEGILTVISGVITVIVGIFKVFTGILTGDWEKAWDGVKDILKGAREVLVGIVKMIVARIKLVFTGIIGILKGIMKRSFEAMRDATANGGRIVRNAVIGVKDKIVGVFKNAGSWLYTAGRRIISGIVSGVKSMGGAIMGAVRDMIPDSIERFVPGFAHGGISGAAGGGPRSNLVMVGEQGREMVRLPFGSTVIPNGATEAAMSGGGGGSGVVQLQWVGGNGGDEFMTWLKKNIRATAGSGTDSVQRALGV